jgi:hypothetical protein
MAVQGLANPDFKVRRAKEHLDALKKEITAFSESKPYKISTQDDEKAGKHVITVQMQIPPVWPIGTIAGDFICCLRSSLDHLAWKMAAVNLIPAKASPSNKVQFPVCGKDTLDAQVAIVNMTYGIPDEAITLMKSFQPYNSGDLYKTHHLWRLHKLWNIDKHRYIPLHSGFVQLDFPKLPRDVTPPEFEVVNDSGVMRFPLSLKPKLDFNPRPGVDVQFGDQKEGIVLTVKDFIDIYKFVTDKVMPAFVRFLS